MLTYLKAYKHKSYKRKPNLGSLLYRFYYAHLYNWRKHWACMSGTPPANSSYMANKQNSQKLEPGSREKLIKEFEKLKELAEKAEPLKDWVSLDNVVRVGYSPSQLTGRGTEYLVAGGVIIAKFFNGTIAGEAPLGNTEKTKV